MFKSYTSAFIPYLVQSLTNSLLKLGPFFKGLVIGLQVMAIWFNNPQGPPSGVWTGQINPQFSGKSFLTVVVFISAKYAPLCILLKWLIYLILFSLSAITVKPLAYIRSRPEPDFRLPVDKRYSIFFPIDVYYSIALFRKFMSTVLLASFSRNPSFKILALSDYKVSSNFSLRNI